MCPGVGTRRGGYAELARRHGYHSDYREFYSIASAASHASMFGVAGNQTASAGQTVWQLAPSAFSVPYATEHGFRYARDALRNLPTGARTAQLMLSLEDTGQLLETLERAGSAVKRNRDVLAWHHSSNYVIVYSAFDGATPGQAPEATSCEELPWHEIWLALDVTDHSMAEIDPPTTLDAEIVAMVEQCRVQMHAGEGPRPRVLLFLDPGISAPIQRGRWGPIDPTHPALAPHLDFVAGQLDESRRRLHQMATLEIGNPDPGQRPDPPNCG